MAVKRICWDFPLCFLLLPYTSGMKLKLSICSLTSVYENPTNRNFSCPTHPYPSYNKRNREKSWFISYLHFPFSGVPVLPKDKIRSWGSQNMPVQCTPSKDSLPPQQTPPNVRQLITHRAIRRKCLYRPSSLGISTFPPVPIFFLSRISNNAE